MKSCLSTVSACARLLRRILEDFSIHRREIREAIWLWQLLHACVSVATADQWWPVSNGAGHSDESLSVQLDIPSATARKWRMRLEKFGFVRSTKVGPRKRRLEVSSTEAMKARVPSTYGVNLGKLGTFGATA